MAFWSRYKILAWEVRAWAESKISSPSFFTFIASFFFSFTEYLVGFILVRKNFRKAFRIVGLDERRDRWVVEQDFHGYFQISVTQFFAFCSGTLDWIVVTLVWFKRSLYSAQVSRQSCPWLLKLVTSQAVEGHGSARVVMGGSGMNEGLIIPLCWHDTLWPLLRIAGFLPASWPVQWSSVEVTSKYRPTHLPWWQLTLHTVIIQHAYCPGSCGFLQ